jgi:hypothetical protein
MLEVDEGLAERVVVVPVAQVSLNHGTTHHRRQRWSNQVRSGDGFVGILQREVVVDEVGHCLSHDSLDLRGGSSGGGDVGRRHGGGFALVRLMARPET